MEFPKEDVLPTGYNVTIVCTSNFSKENWGLHYYGQPYWIQYFFNDDYIGDCGGGERSVDSEDSKVCTFVIHNATERDSGNHSCISRNQMSCTFGAVHLDFQGKPINFPLLLLFPTFPTFFLFFSFNFLVYIIYLFVSSLCFVDIYVERVTDFQLSGFRSKQKSIGKGSFKMLLNEGLYTVSTCTRGKNVRGL